MIANKAAWRFKGYPTNIHFFVLKFSSKERLAGFTFAVVKKMKNRDDEDDYTIYKLLIVAIIMKILRAFNPGHLLLVNLFGSQEHSKTNQPFKVAISKHPSK